MLNFFFCPFKSGGAKPPPTKPPPTEPPPKEPPSKEPPAPPSQQKQPPPPSPGGDKLVMGPNVKLLDSDNFMDTIARDVTFVKFSVPKCGPCEKLAPVWDRLAAMFKRRADVKIVNVDCSKDGALCREQGVTKYPTFFIYKNGEQLAQYTGNYTYIDLLAFLRKYLF